MIEVDIKLHGFDEIRQLLLRDLPDEVKMKVNKQSVKDTAQIMLGYALSNSPYRSGALRRNIKLVMKRGNLPWMQGAGLRVKTARKLTRVMGRAEGYLPGERAAVAKGANDPYYWRFMEWGYHDRSGNFHEGKHFIERALAEHIGEHIDGYRRAFVPRFESVVKRLHAKQRRNTRASMSSMK